MSPRARTSSLALLNYVYVGNPLYIIGYCNLTMERNLGERVLIAALPNKPRQAFAGPGGNAKAITLSSSTKALEAVPEPWNFDPGETEAASTGISFPIPEAVVCDKNESCGVTREIDAAGVLENERELATPVAETHTRPAKDVDTRREVEGVTQGPQAVEGLVRRGVKFEEEDEGGRSKSSTRTVFRCDIYCRAVSAWSAYVGDGIRLPHTLQKQKQI